MAADPFAADAVDDILNYSDNDPFEDDPFSASRDKSAASPQGTKRKFDDDKENGLGLDEEVKIAKKRKPIVKLDENRLLSAPGIPKLRSIARSSSVTRKLRMKGKGHEFSDIAKLLNFYQLWLDGLYPRAKFADGLQLIEKVGHSKRMQVMRKEWINENKPGYIRPGTELVESILNADLPAASHAGHNGQPTRGPETSDMPDDEADMFFPSPGKGKPRQTTSTEDPDDDELDALLAMQDSGAVEKTRPPRTEQDSEGEDDLDALLAEQDSRRQPGAALAPATTAADDQDEDDLDALLAEQESRNTMAQPTVQPETSSRPSSRSSAIKKQRTIFDDSDTEEEEEDTQAALPAQPGRELTPPTSPAHINLAAAAQQAQKEVEGKADSNEDESQESAAKTFSSSPLRNEAFGMKTYSSSPLPNNPELEDDLDALLAEAEM